jgi:hypothetical protein
MRSAPDQLAPESCACIAYSLAIFSCSGSQKDCHSRASKRRGASIVGEVRGDGRIKATAAPSHMLTLIEKLMFTATAMLAANTPAAPLIAQNQVWVADRSR